MNRKSCALVARPGPFQHRQRQWRVPLVFKLTVTHSYRTPGTCNPPIRQLCFLSYVSLHCLLVNRGVFQRCVETNFDSPKFEPQTNPETSPHRFVCRTPANLAILLTDRNEQARRGMEADSPRKLRDSNHPSPCNI